MLFDAGSTLWYSEPPESTWHRILADLGVDVSAERVDKAWEKALAQLMPKFIELESSGHPNDFATIDQLFAESELVVVEELGVSVDRKALRTLAKDLFPSGSSLYPETIEVLAKLRAMGLLVAIVSNGVSQEEVSARLGIDVYCDPIIGSVHVGYAKPAPEIFHLALNALAVGPEEAIMVGDNWEVDVLGARGVGLRGIHIARGDEESPGIDSIKDLWGVVDIVTERT